MNYINCECGKVIKGTSEEQCIYNLKVHIEFMHDNKKNNKGEEK